MNIISLGAGVQSSVMSLMAENGEITPSPDAAIFADTGSEPKGVYDWLDWIEDRLSFPVYRVSAGNLELDSLRLRQKQDGSVYTKTLIPMFTKNKTNGSYGMIIRRTCTVDYKIKPILRKIRELAGIKRGQNNVTVSNWIGISLDEASRMKDSPVPWASTRYPLVEKRMSRHDCLIWMKKNNYPTPPRSSCYFCPFHSNNEWRRMKTEDKISFEKAVHYEKLLIQTKSKTDNFGSVPFLHPKRISLDEIDFRSEEDNGQLNLFINDCNGVCGT